MTSDYNDKIVDKDNCQSEMKTYQNHTCVNILEFGMENAPDPSYINEWEECLVELEFYEIVAIAAHVKPRKGIYMEYLSKVWRIELESDQKTPNVKTHIGVSTENTKLSRNFDTGDRMLKYKRITKKSLWILYLRQKNLEIRRKVTHAANY